MFASAPDTAIDAARRDWRLMVLPMALLLIGLTVRYLAYASVTPQPSPYGYVTATCVWDCYWYGDIALKGYQAYPEQLNFGGPAGIANWAFFPLYPLFIGLLQRVTSIGPAMLGAIVSPLLTLTAVLLSWPLFNGDRRAYWLFAVLLLVGPFSFYFSILYSESLFLCLTVLAFVQLRRRDYLGAGLAGALLSATRIVGVLFVFSIVIAAYRQHREEGGGFRSFRRAVLGVLLAPLGLLAFMVLLHQVTGDALAFAHIQRAWDRMAGNPFGYLATALSSPGVPGRDIPLLGMAALVGFALTGVLALKRQFPEAVFCALILLISLTNGVESMVRFVAALAPLGIVLCQLLGRWRPLFVLSLVVFVVLDFEWTIGWIHQRGALM
jgi:hypothetical protein